MKKKHNRNGIKGFLIGIVLISIVIGYFYYLSNKKSGEAQSEEVQVTVVQEVLMRNLENNYPPSPREVLKYYGELMQCFYCEEYTEEEFLQLAMQIQELYDDELVANKTQQQYLEDLKWDIDNFKEQGIVVSSYSLPSSTDVEEFKQDGFRWAKLYCSFTLRKGTQLDVTNEVFLLRKDDAGHWKIYGWMLAEDEEQSTQS
ncbi:MAG: hypothetical protein Q4D94_14050 [Bacillota bacterium]|nr:hypothetical protein [Bacillota bacterium]